MPQITDITRDGARSLWAWYDLRHDTLTLDELEELRTEIDDRLRASGLIKNYRASKRATIKRTPHGVIADIRCQAYYFKDRQAVTFEPNGFVGFAGWADDINVQPILAAFAGWAATMSIRKAKSQ